MIEHRRGKCAIMHGDDRQRLLAVDVCRYIHLGLTGLTIQCT